MWPGTTKGCQVPKQCFRNVTFETWNFSEICHWKHDVQTLSRIVTFRIRNVLDMSCSKPDIFKKCDIENMEINVSEMWGLEHGMFQICGIQNLKFYRNMTLNTYEMFQKHGVQTLKCFRKCNIQNMKCFINVMFKTWNFSEMWHWKHGNYCVQNVTLKTWNFIETWRPTHMKCFRNMTFKPWNVSKM